MTSSAPILKTYAVAAMTGAFVLGGLFGYEGQQMTQNKELEELRAKSSKIDSIFKSSERHFDADIKDGQVIITDTLYGVRASTLSSAGLTLGL